MYCIYLIIKQDLFVITKIRHHLTSDTTVCRGKDHLGTVACLEIHEDSGTLNLWQEIRYPDWAFWWYSSVSLGTFQDSTSIREWPLPSKSFLIHSSPSILSFNSIQSKMPTVSLNKCILKQQWPTCLKTYMVCNELTYRWDMRKETHAKLWQRV